MRALTVEEHPDLHLLRAHPDVAADGPELIDEPAVILDAEGDPIAAYGPLDSEPGLHAALREGMRAVAPRQTGMRSGGMATRALPFGYRPRMISRKMEWCALFGLSRDEPALHELLVHLGETAARCIGEVQPERLAQQLNLIEKVQPDYRLGPESPFTSGIINYDSALEYHRDRGNFAGTWNVMATFREASEGGELVVPSLGVSFACADATLSVFDAQARVHGVAPIRRQQRGGYRISVVFYALSALQHCLPCEEEVRNAQRIRTLREERRAGLRPDDVREVHR